MTFVTLPQMYTWKMENELRAKTERAKELLRTVRHPAMATVNEDSSPHNTPFYCLVDDSREHVYWASSPDSVHSQNLRRTGQAFIVIYEAGKGGGLYLRGQNAHTLSGDELEQGLAIWNSQRAEGGKPAVDADFFTGASLQRLYCIDLVRYYVNHSEKDAAGNVLRDTRTQITRQDLLTETE